MKIKSTERLRSALHNAIIEAINCGDFQPGDALPSESQLAENFDVSRNSVRDALASLEQSGVIVRRQGIGTIVAPFSDRLRVRVDLTASMLELIKGSGYEPSIDFDRIAIVTGPSYGHQTLSIDDSGEVVFRERLYCASGNPAMLIQDYFDAHLLQDANDIHEIDGTTIDYLETKYNKRTRYLFSSFDAVAANEDQAHLMKIHEGFPLLNQNYKFLDEDLDLLICARVFYNMRFIDLELFRVRDF